MKLFAYSFLIFFVAVQVLNLYFKEYIENSDFIVRNTKISILPEKVKDGAVVSFGDSTNMSSFIPPATGEWFNLALPCGSSFENYTVLRRLLKRNIQLKKVILSFHYEMLFNVENCFFDLTLKHNIFKFSELQPVFDDESLRSYSPLLKSSFLNYSDLVLSQLNLLSGQIENLKVKNYSLNYTENQTVKSSIDRDFGFYSVGDVKEFPFTVSQLVGDQVKMHPITLNYLEKMISELNERKIPIVFVNPPYGKMYEPYVSAALFKEFERLMKEFEIKYSFFKYLPDELFLDKEYFHDRVHANVEGAKLYTSWLLSRVQ